MRSGIMGALFKPYHDMETGMQSSWPSTRSVIVAATVAVAAAFAPMVSHSQTKEFEPVVGQEGKDVIWVPTPQSLVERMLEMAKTTSKDYVIDLGSGDGRTVITAAKKYGVQALGIEYNPDMVALSRRNAEKEGVADRAQFIQGDIFKTDFSKATVLTLYLLPSVNMKLRPKLLSELKPGTRVVSHNYDMGDWKPDQTVELEGHTVYLWTVKERDKRAAR